VFLYAHLALAHRLAQKIPVEHMGDYLLGSIMPDIRYFVDQPREWTHISIAEVNSLEIPSGEVSFNTGYKVHLAIDELSVEHDVIRAIRDTLPRLFAKRLSNQLVNTIPDLYYLRECRFSIPRPNKFEFVLTSHLDIRPDLVVYAYDMCEVFFRNPTPRNGIRLLGRSKLLSRKRTRLVALIGLLGLSLPGAESVLMARIGNLLNEFEREVLNRVPAIVVSGET